MKLKVTAPYDGHLIAEIDTVGSKQVDKALATAKALFQNRANWLPAAKRIQILENAAEIMREHEEDLALQAATEGGKPLMDSRVEVERAIDGMRNCAECIRTEVGREIPMGINAASEGRMAFTRREPIGVVVAVSAFNHPLNLIVHQIGPAIATGCPVIVKPATNTPLSCIRLVEILRQAGLPEAWCQICVTESNTVATELVTDPRVNFFSFIGSAKIGWMLRSKLAPGVRCALEHGGAAPVIIAEDANLDNTLPLLAKGGFYHAGQVCVSVQRVYVQASIVNKVAETLATLGSDMKVGDPKSAETEIGPLISHGEVDRVDEWVKQALDLGAKLLCGGERISNSCYQPTVLLNPPDNATVSQKEIFGPVICVYSIDSIDEGIQRANALPFSFQAAVCTQNIDTALLCYKHLNASAVMVNDHTAFRVDWMPFAGLNSSGLGVGGIPNTYHEMQIEKMMVLKSPSL